MWRRDASATAAAVQGGGVLRVEQSEAAAVGSSAGVTSADRDCGGGCYGGGEAYQDSQACREDPHLMFC